jgi:S1-C subfamily serine protease
VNALDIILVLLVVTVALRGYRRGAFSLVGSFAGSLGGFLLGASFAPELAGMVVDEPGLGLATLTLGILLVSLLAGQAVGLAIGHRLRAAVAEVGAAPADRAAGIAVGVAGLVAVVWLLGGVLAQGPWPGFAQQMRESRVVTELDQLLPPPPDVVARAGAYLDRQGFPQAFSGLGGPVAPPVDPPTEGAVAAAAEAGQPSTVRIEALGCGAASLGSGFATSGGYVVTNAHVVAGAEAITVRDQAGSHDGEAILVDERVDLAVLRVPALEAPAIGWVEEPAERGTSGATLGFPGQGSTLEVRAAAVRARTTAVGHDIYGRGGVARDILTVSAPVERGDSGGPFVTADGLVGGVVFAASRSEDGTGYVLTAESVRDDVAEAIDRDTVADTGACRF